MGRLSGALRCVKYLLLTFNLIFLLAGTAVIAIGLWLRFNWKIDDLNVHFNDNKEFFGAFFMGLYVLIGAGVLMMIIGFFGCCGAARESQCLLGAFFACLLVIFAAEVAAGVFAFLGKTSTIEALKESYSKAYDEFPKNSKANSTLSSFHQEMQCCGNEDPESVKHVGSLCHPDHQEHKDCLQEIDKQLNQAFQIVGILAITTAGITIFGMIFSMVLCCAIRNSRDML